MDMDKSSRIHATLKISSEYSRRSWDKPQNSKSKIKRGSEFIVYLSSLSRNFNSSDPVVGKLARAISLNVEKDLQSAQQHYVAKLTELKAALSEYRAAMPVFGEEPRSFEKERPIPSRYCCSLTYQFFNVYSQYDACSRVLEQLRQLGATTYDQHKKDQFALAKEMRVLIEQNSAHIAVFHKKRKALEKASL